MDSSIPHTQNVQTIPSHHDMRAILPPRSYNQSQPFSQPGQPPQPHLKHAQDQQQQARVQGSNTNSLAPPIAHNITSHPDTRHPGGYGHRHNDIPGYAAQRLPSSSQSVDGHQMYSSQPTTLQATKQSNLGGNASTAHFPQTSGLPASSGNFHPQQQDQRRHTVPTTAQIPSSSYGHRLSGLQMSSQPYIQQSSSGFVSGQYLQRTSLPGSQQQEQQRPPPPPQQHYQQQPQPSQQHYQHPPPPQQYYQQPPPPQQRHPQPPAPQSFTSFQNQGPIGETRNNQTTVPTQANQNASVGRNSHPGFSTLPYPSQTTTHMPRSTVHAAGTSNHPSHPGLNHVSTDTSGQNMAVAAAPPSNGQALPHPHPHLSTASPSDAISTFRTNQIMGPLKDAMNTVFNSSYIQLLDVYQTSSEKLQNDIAARHRAWQLEKLKLEQAVRVFAAEKEGWKVRESQLEKERDMWRSECQKQQEEQVGSQPGLRVHVCPREEHPVKGNGGELSNDKLQGGHGELEELKRVWKIPDEVVANIKAQILNESRGRIGQLIQHCHQAIQARHNAEQKVLALESQLRIAKNDVVGASKSDYSEGAGREPTNHGIKRELETEREGSERRSPTLLPVSPHSAKVEVWAEEGKYQEHPESHEPPTQTTHPSTPLTPGPSSFSPVDQGLVSYLQSGEHERKIIDRALTTFSSSLAEAVSTIYSAQSIDTTPTAQIRGAETALSSPEECRPSKRRRISAGTGTTEVTMQDTHDQLSSTDLAANAVQCSDTEPSAPITINECTQAECAPVCAEDDPPFGAKQIDVIFDTNPDGMMFCRLCFVRELDADPKITSMDTVTSFPASSDPAELIEHATGYHAIVAKAFAKLSTPELEDMRSELILFSQMADPLGAKGESRGKVINQDTPQLEENVNGGLETEVEAAEVVAMKIED